MLTYSLNDCTEKLRKWFSAKIVKPLWRDIQDVERRFEETGIPHLGPRQPASLYNGSAPMLSDKPRTLLELSREYPKEPVVLARLRVEKFLAFADISGSRSMVIQRIGEFAKDDLILSYCRGTDRLPYGSEKAEQANSDPHVISAHDLLDNLAPLLHIHGRSLACGGRRKGLF